MRTTFIQATVVSATVLLGIGMWLGGSTQAEEKPTVPATTNWVGGLVVAKKEMGDPIAGHQLFPHADADIEIGLRSDGAVVWRKRSKN